MWYDPDPMSTIIEEDVDFLKSYYEIPDEDIAPKKNISVAAPYRIEQRDDGK